jgi:hypothetical protein
MLQSIYQAYKGPVSEAGSFYSVDTEEKKKEALASLKTFH